MSVCLSVCLPLSVRMSVCLFVCISLGRSVYLNSGWVSAAPMVLFKYRNGATWSNSTFAKINIHCTTQKYHAAAAIPYITYHLTPCHTTQFHAISCHNTLVVTKPGQNFLGRRLPAPIEHPHSVTPTVAVPYYIFAHGVLRSLQGGPRIGRFPKGGKTVELCDWNHLCLFRGRWMGNVLKDGLFSEHCCFFCRQQSVYMGFVFTTILHLVTLELSTLI